MSYLAENLEHRMKLRGMGPSDVSQMSGVHVATILNVLHGKDCSLETLRALSVALKCSTDVLLFGQDVSDDLYEIITQAETIVRHMTADRLDVAKEHLHKCFDTMKGVIDAI